MADGNQQPKRSRWSFLRRLTRFNLKFFLILVAGLCCYTSLHVYRANQQKQIAEEITKYGGWLRYDFQFTDGKFDDQADSWVPPSLLQSLGIDFFHSISEVNLVYTNDLGGRRDNENLNPAPLNQIGKLRDLKKLYLHEYQANDENLIHVGKLKQLNTFFVWDAYEVSDNGIAHLANLKNLERIHVTESKITDKSLEVFGDMKKLKALTLQFNQFSDAGISHLANLEDLESLWVCGVRANDNDHQVIHQEKFDSTKGENLLITDKSWKVFRGFKKLNRLGIQATGLSPESIEKYKQENPGCKVYH